METTKIADSKKIEKSQVDKKPKAVRKPQPSRKSKNVVEVRVVPMIDSEKKLEAALRERTRELSGYALKFHCLSFAGFPDRIVMMPHGKIYFVELKTTGKKPSKIQDVCHRSLARLEHQFFLIDSKQSLQAFINHIKAEQLPYVTGI